MESGEGEVPISHKKQIGKSFVNTSVQFYLYSKIKKDKKQ